MGLVLTKPSKDGTSRRRERVDVLNRVQGEIKSGTEENSPALQWLGPLTSTAGAQVVSLIGELRSCKPQGMGKSKMRKLRTDHFSGG